MGEVIFPFGKSAETVSDDIVADLEVILEAAKRGEISSIAYTYVSPNKDITVGWTQGTVGASDMLAGVTGLQALYQRYWLE